MLIFPSYPLYSTGAVMDLHYEGLIAVICRPRLACNLKFQPWEKNLPTIMSQAYVLIISFK